MECTRNLGGCKVEGSFRFFFRNGQHPFHPCHGAISFLRLFEVLNGREAPGRRRQPVR